MYKILVGSYLFTRYDNYLTREEALDILVDIPSFNGELPPPEIKANTPWINCPIISLTINTLLKKTWSGRQIFSLVIPSVNFEKKNKSYNNEPNFKNNVVIEKGIVKSGTFDKNILGSSEQGLIHTIFNDCGKKRTQQFLDDIQNIVTNFVLKSGF